MAKKIENIIIHHSYSSWGDVDVIRKWHLERGWRDVGYSVVVLNGHRKYKSKYNEKEDGMLEMGRGLDFDKYIDSKERGAHTLGYNTNSIGICFIAMEKPTKKQEETLIEFIKLWKKIIPDIKVKGHNETCSTECPGFDVQKWLKEKNLI
jgi:hypothetical protein